MPNSVFRAKRCESSGELAGVETHQINKRNITTESYNSRSILFGFLSQLIQEQGVQPFPVDYKSINNISQNYGTSDVMFMVVDHTYKPSMNPAVLFLSVITYYTLPVYLPLKLFSGNQTNLTVLIMDINTGKLKTGSVFRFHESLRKHNIGSRMFNLFMHVKTPPVSDNE